MPKLTIEIEARNKKQALKLLKELSEVATNQLSKGDSYGSQDHSHKANICWK